MASLHGTSENGSGFRSNGGGRDGSSRSGIPTSSLRGSMGSSMAGTSRKRVREAGAANGDGAAPLLPSTASGARSGPSAMQLENALPSPTPSLSLSDDSMIVAFPNNGMLDNGFPHEIHPEDIHPDELNENDDIEEDIDFPHYTSHSHNPSSDINSLTRSVQSRHTLSATFVPYYPHLGIDDLDHK